MTTLPTIPQLDVHLWAYLAWGKDFVTANITSISCTMALLKVIAKKTPWAADDKILTLLGNLIPTKKLSIFKK